MEEALRETVYCDHGHQRLQAIAAGLRAGDADPFTIARKTFYFVRDRFPFGFDLYRRKASETLRRGYGVCWNKALLLVALLRSNQIPAQFGSVPVKRTFVEPAIGAWHRLANDPFNHCLVRAYVNQRWFILDAVLDQKTFAAFYQPRGVAWGIDWNGADDVRLYTEYVVGPPVFYPDLDVALKGKVGNYELPPPLAALGNWWVNKRMWGKNGNRPADRVFLQVSNRK